MKQAHHELDFDTTGRRLYDITAQTASWLSHQKIADGLLTFFIRHTSASLIIQENADPAVLDDLNTFFARLVPDGDPAYRHRSEGPDDMPAHIRGALTQTSLSIPVRDHRMVLGTWQGIYLFEHRAAPHRRHIALHLIGDLIGESPANP
jgi:secondary thiamine-phosphate synthase enzyme